MINRACYVIGFLLCFGCLPVAAQTPGAVSAELLSESPTIKPGEPFWVSVRLQASEGLYVPWKNPGQQGHPPNVYWKLPEGFRAGSIEWPSPEKIECGGGACFGYPEGADLLTLVIPPKLLADGALADLAASVEWSACRGSQCSSGFKELSLRLPVSRRSPALSDLALNEAKRALPQPQVDMDVRAVQDEERVYLYSAFKGDPENLHFFPWDEGLVDWGTGIRAQKWRGGALLSIPKNKAAPFFPSRLRGVLKDPTPQADRVWKRGVWIDVRLEPKAGWSAFWDVPISGIPWIATALLCGCLAVLVFRRIMRG
ncbi:MAG: hypothetical protein HQL11_04200 [Candidatus Omnitrophica bacterium]|nr:hypothetical protein [Candidatus Omnitrophota bacterium]